MSGGTCSHHRTLLSAHEGTDAGRETGRDGGERRNGRKERRREKERRDMVPGFCALKERFDDQSLEPIDGSAQLEFQPFELQLARFLPHPVLKPQNHPLSDTAKDSFSLSQTPCTAGVRAEHRGAGRRRGTATARRVVRCAGVAEEEQDDEAAFSGDGHRMVAMG